MSRKLTFVLGGARSGKSRYAQDLALQWGGRVAVIATAEALDDEMRSRIAVHRAERPAGWKTVACPLHVGAALQTVAADTVIVDCITLLVSNVLLAEGEHASAQQAAQSVDRELDELLSAWQGAERAVIVVSNEVGMGLVPPYPLGRIYRDVLGRANQRLAQAAGEVVLLVAGLPLRIK